MTGLGLAASPTHEMFYPKTPKNKKTPKYFAEFIIFYSTLAIFLVAWVFFSRKKTKKKPKHFIKIIVFYSILNFFFASVADYLISHTPDMGAKLDSTQIFHDRCWVAALGMIGLGREVVSK